MKIISNNEEFNIEGFGAIAIGKFDGIHLGHQKLLKEILKRKSFGEKAIVFTFDPAPSEYFALKSGKNYSEKEITTKQEKRDYFQKAGIDILVEFPMNDSTAIMEPEIFVKKILIDSLHVKFIAAGTDLSFGNKGRGDTSLLKTMAQEFGFKVDVIHKVCYEGNEISSTYIRNSILSGQVDKMPQLLGRNYSFSGLVQHGHKIGQKLDVPTVNLGIQSKKLLPPFGVYFSKVEVDQRIFYGISNLGTKPTISDHEAVGLETYIYNFSQELYDKEIQVELLKFWREEIKFTTKEELKEQMKIDIEAGKNYHQI